MYVFYCFAAILPAAGVYSIISLFTTGLLMNVLRPLLLENASAVPYNGGNYSYLINFTSKGLAIIAAAITALDAITTVLLSSQYNLTLDSRVCWECNRISCRRGRPTIPQGIDDCLDSNHVFWNLSAWN